MPISKRSSLNGTGAPRRWQWFAKRRGPGSPWSDPYRRASSRLSPGRRRVCGTADNGSTDPFHDKSSKCGPHVDSPAGGAQVDTRTVRAGTTDMPVIHAQ